MRLSAINSILSFKNTPFPDKKSSAGITNIQVSQANTDGRWFYSDCKNPSFKVYADEVKQKNQQEYFLISRDENGAEKHIPIKNTATLEDGKTVFSENSKLKDFAGVSYIKRNGEILREIHYLKGYPITITDYKDGQEFKLTRFSQHNHKINQVYYFDGSFDISKKSNPNEVSISLQDTNEFGEKTAIQIRAVKQKGAGKVLCEFPYDYGYKTLYLEWSYPNMKHSFRESAEDAKNLRSALTHLREVINRDEYKEDFGSNSDVQSQLTAAIDFLDGKIKN